jgi:beta-glucosidase
MTSPSTSKNAVVIEESLEKLSVEEKVNLLTGGGWFETAEFAHADIAKVVMSDGPHGLRLQSRSSQDDANAGLATCFPPAVALGSTWDVDLARRIGIALGEECRKEGVHLLLGPGVNIKRSPLCGRNFEYFSEDPFLSGRFGAAWVTGLQSQGVGASLKHFAANNQESFRMTTSVEIDERSLQEIYLRAFEHVIRSANPWTVMCSYNRINGTYASQDEWLLKTVLREKWGYRGLVVSDWGAVVDRVAALKAGLDLEMPRSKRGPEELLASMVSGDTSVELLDTSARRVIELARKSQEMISLSSYDVEGHHALAREVAARSIVLLKNDAGLLPLEPGASQSIAVIGEFAKTPRYQGDGSSRVSPSRLDNAFDSLVAVAPAATFSFASGFPIDGTLPATSELHDEALEVARNADVVVAFLGLSADDESEGFDRLSIDLQPEQIELVRDIVAINPKVVVILSNGSAVKLSGWTEEIPVLVESWLLGQAGGSAIADVVFGRSNPSGRLTETISLKLEDTPAFLNFPGEYDRVRYGEGTHVGYRYYDKKDMDVSYPFGYGLSYTTFDYGDVEVRSGHDGIDVSLVVSNTGNRDGYETVQLYVGARNSKVPRALRELKAFSSVLVPKGESAQVSMHVDRSELAYFDPLASDWVVEGTDYAVEVGASSRDIRALEMVSIPGDDFLPELSLLSTYGEWMGQSRGGAALAALLEKFALQGRGITDVDSVAFKMIAGLRLQQFIDMFGLALSPEDLDGLLGSANRR